MRTISRAEADRLQGKTPAKPAEPTYMPVPAADNTQLEAMMRAMTTMADNIALLPQLLAAAQPAPEPKPKQLIAIPERDRDGKLTRLVVDIIS